MLRVLDRLHADYRSGRLSVVRSQFLEGTAASSLRARMELWREEGLPDLHVALTYTHRLGPLDTVGEVEFAGDPRTMPSYSIYRFHWTGTSMRIAGTVSGLRGTTFANTNWTVTRTAHFVVYHSPYQLVGSDRHYLPELESQRRQLQQKFHVVARRVAPMYVYPDQATMSRLTGGGCGRAPGEIGCTAANSGIPVVQTLIQAVLHEAVHVFEGALVPPPPDREHVYVAPRFIAEGMAAALQNKEADPRLSDYCSPRLVFVPLQKCAKIALYDTRPSNLLTDKGFARADPSDAYALGASFVAYLIGHGGYVKFGHFYYKLAGQPADRPADYDVAARAVYGVPISNLLQHWTGSLCPSGC
jgi:hypothetical protein